MSQIVNDVPMGVEYSVQMGDGCLNRMPLVTILVNQIEGVHLGAVLNHNQEKDPSYDLGKFLSGLPQGQSHQTPLVQMTRRVISCAPFILIDARDPEQVKNLQNMMNEEQMRSM